MKLPPFGYFTRYPSRPAHAVDDLAGGFSDGGGDGTLGTTDGREGYCLAWAGRVGDFKSQPAPLLSWPVKTNGYLNVT